MVASRISEFTPEAMSTRLDQIRQQHPTRSIHSEVDVTSDTLEFLRRKLETTGHDALALQELSATLSPKELRAAVHLMFEEKFYERAAQVLKSRPRRDVMAIGWATLLTRYPSPELEAVVRDLAEKVDCDLIGARELGPNRVKNWLAAYTVDYQIMTEWENLAAKRREDLLPWLSSNGLGSYPRLQRSVIRRMLTEGKARTLLAVPSHKLIAYAEQMDRDAQAMFSRHYLVDVRPMQSWSDQVVTWIISKWGKPTSSELQGFFWKTTTKEVRGEIRTWLAIRELKSFLEEFNDSDGRFSFWEPFVRKHIKDIKLACQDPSTRQFSAICMEFNGWGVVEFGPTGNAAYVYPRAAYREMTSRKAATPSAYKDRRKTLKGGTGGDGRIIHREGWQEANERWISRLIQRGGT